MIKLFEILIFKYIRRISAIRTSGFALCYTMIPREVNIIFCVVCMINAFVLVSRVSYHPLVPAPPPIQGVP